MSDIPPIQCACGLMAFTDIRINAAGVLSMTCFQCRQTHHVNVSALMAEQAWNQAQAITPTPTTPTKPRPLEPAGPERPERYGYKLGGLL